MTDARIPVEIRLKGNFGSMLAGMGSSVLAEWLVRTSGKARAQPELELNSK
jgi:hypothetical protein